MTETDELSSRPIKPWYKKWWIWALIALSVVILAAALSPTLEEESAAPVDTITTEASESTTTTTSETTTTEASESTTTSVAKTTTTVSATTTQPTTTTQPATTTTTLPVVFSDGTWLIGDEIEAGLYVTIELDPSSCYWERLSGLSGGLEDILANANPEGKALVEIKDGDEAFSAQRCGGWTYPRVLDEPLMIFADGYWVVGDQIAPGRYRNDGESFCYWERLAGFTGELGDIKANDNVDGSTIVDISASDVGFSSSRCGTWTLIDG
jgi:hypothetical protein